jgi:hypothetical protein
MAGETVVPQTKTQRIHAALDELLQRAHLHKTHGTGYIRVDFSEGGPTTFRISLEELKK